MWILKTQHRIFRRHHQHTYSTRVGEQGIYPMWYDVNLNMSATIFGRRLYCKDVSMEKYRDVTGLCATRALG